MKVKIKTYNDFLVDYLSTDKVYEVTEVIADDLVCIINDVGDCITIRLPSCAHLNYGVWEIVND